MSKLLQQLRTRIEGMHGDFWARFDRDSAAGEELKQPHVRRLGVVRYWHELFKYIHDRRPLMEHEALEIVTAFENKFMEPGGYMSVVEGIALHWKSWRHREAAFEEVRRAPKPECCYVAGDFAELLE